MKAQKSLFKRGYDRLELPDKNVEITLDNGDIVKGILDYAHFIAGLDMNVSKQWFVVINDDNLSGIAALFRYSNVIEIKEKQL